MIEIKTLFGPAGQQEAAKSVLKSLGVPSHSASVSEENHDTGYPGLAINSTIVRLNVSKKMMRKIIAAFKNLGFSER